MFGFLRSPETQLKVKRMFEFVVGLVVLLVLVAIALAVLGSLRHGVTTDRAFSYPSYMGGSSSGGYSYGIAPQYKETGQSDFAVESRTPELSERNIAHSNTTMPSQDTEVQTRAYAAEFRTSDVTRLCVALKNLEGAQGAQLVHSSMNDEWCSLRYRVERNVTQAFADELATHNPRSLTEVVESIEETIRDFSGARATLEKKQVLLTETLDASTASYEELIAVATERGDADALAAAISGKLAHLERLTREALMVEEELRTLDRRFAKELERVQYSFFDITVSAYPHLPMSELRESWAQAMRELAVHTNRFVQGATIGLVTVLLVLVQAVLYLGVVFLVGRFVYKQARPYVVGCSTPSSPTNTKHHTVARSKKPVA